ncbi:hypothetical protein H8R29_23480 [Priestia megaterium]|uniref:Uncharacterized protein n=1 Tax=Priestia megaterium (strain ATCC 14581 / DSM 32 / CCUG 1817 / JCM 2506 / NBRC 15308 / NCIMB 9376 / NCTC 10342 / NRRL B-14308 / VKM B-512 / Ford 19) TaxID=1348623 RepID=A0A0B6AS41_PRIM2|nr:hypothetical protein [Priestia megaterium]AJI23912.1 hypothetical protein BG04_1425 [Priestia megaterium NBRC 15308 = ATCC 14581]KGJ84247.1 hypothetical protein BMT_13310 [Priestia megaterium NBRC 15308 = ATCC 14581]MDR4230470.1 hypothetical protein [Priestia megaterium]MED3805623.1 hypothetical protein [Priestia megaterium]MED4396337.1 hypothetical protein [Priestia megaterium]
MEEIIGKVWLNRDWEGESCRDFMEVSSIIECKDTLDEKLIDYEGKTVRIVIEEINCEQLKSLQKK